MRLLIKKEEERLKSQATASSQQPEAAAHELQEAGLQRGVRGVRASGVNRVQGLGLIGFRVWGLGCRVWGLGSLFVRNGPF